VCSTVKEYQEMATKWSKEWRNRRYSNTKPASNVTSGDCAASAPPNEQMSANIDVSPPIPIATTSSDQDQVNENQTNEENANVMTPASLEQNYWEIVEGQEQEVDVEYGNDVDTTEVGSGFPISDRGRSVNSPNFLVKDSPELPEPKFGTEEYYKETYWNLNNIPNSKNSVLRHVKVGINGINVPWLYFGCLFSTFCWHNEDNHMYSINYHHRGAPKQ
jgi:hypothetical protein